MYLKISNLGEVQPEALTLLGATNKRGDSSKIGYFGSGFKYSISYLLRNKVEFKIFSGENEIKISTIEKDFRGIKVNVIVIDGKETSLTTDFAADWKKWYVIREIYSNAIDEGEAKISNAKTTKGQKGKTSIYIKLNDNVKKISENLNLYFSGGRKPIYEHKGFKVFRKLKDDSIIYRKGIKVATMKGLYDYDIDSIEINESRTPIYSFTVSERFWEQANLIKENGAHIVRNIITRMNDGHLLEGSLTNGVTAYYGEPNNTWETQLINKTLIDSTDVIFARTKDLIKLQLLPTKFLDKIRGEFPELKYFKIEGNGDEKFKFKEKPTTTEGILITEALHKLKQLEIDIKTPVKVGTFKNPNIMGSVNGDYIIISERCLNNGLQYVMETIIEEEVHKISGAQDETRQMQDELIRMLVNYAAKQKGIII